MAEETQAVAEKEETKKESKSSNSKTIDDILSKVEKMSVIELSDLVKALEDRFDVSAAAPVAVAAAPGGAGAADAGGAETSDEVDVILTAVGSQKIQVLKVVRDLTGMGLKEAKDMVESAPKPIKEKVSKEEAEEIKKKFEEQGATIDIK
jgi:large subunit ribosomal protein L7/L12